MTLTLTPGTLAVARYRPGVSAVTVRVTVTLPARLPTAKDATFMSRACRAAQPRDAQIKSGALDELQVVGVAGVVDQPGGKRLDHGSLAGAGGKEVGVLAAVRVDHVGGGGHHGRLHGGRGPVGIHGHEECAEAGNMRGRHGRSGHHAELVAAGGDG